MGLSVVSSFTLPASACPAGPSVIVIVNVFGALAAGGVPSSTAVTVTVVDPAAAPAVNVSCPVPSTAGCVANSVVSRASTVNETVSDSPDPGSMAVAHGASYAGLLTSTWTSPPLV